MASTATMAKEQQKLSITFEGEEASETTQCEVELTTDAPISEIWTKLEGYYTQSCIAIKHIY